MSPRHAKRSDCVSRTQGYLACLNSSLQNPGRGLGTATTDHQVLGTDYVVDTKTVMSISLVTGKKLEAQFPSAPLQLLTGAGLRLPLRGDSNPCH